MGNDPLNRTDPTGTEGVWDDMRAGAASEQHFYNTGEVTKAPDSAAGTAGVVINAAARATSLGLTVGTFRVPMAKGPNVVIAPIHGNAQKTFKNGVETTHASTSRQVAQSEARRDDAKSVHLNQTVSTITNGEVQSSVRPDVATVRVDGKIDVTEVLSPKQTEAQMTNKITNALGDRCGTITCVK